MTTIVLLHGAQASDWTWHLVEPHLLAEGHEVITPSFPIDDESAGLPEYVDVVLDSLAGTTGAVVLVAHSLAGLVAPVVAQRRPVSLLLLVAPMIPKPGETGFDWWENTGQGTAHAALAELEGWDTSDPRAVFLQDVSDDLFAEATLRLRNQSATVFAEPSPLTDWPDVPTRVIACRDDRFFPLAFLQHQAQDRLGIDVDVIDGGHVPALGNPVGLADEVLRLMRITVPAMQ